MRNFDIAGGIVNRGRGTFPNSLKVIQDNQATTQYYTNKSSEKDNHAQ